MTYANRRNDANIVFPLREGGVERIATRPAQVSSSTSTSSRIMYFPPRSINCAYRSLIFPTSKAWTASSYVSKPISVSISDKSHLSALSNLQRMRHFMPPSPTRVRRRTKSHLGTRLRRRCGGRSLLCPAFHDAYDAVFKLGILVDVHQDVLHGLCLREMDDRRFHGF